MYVCIYCEWCEPHTGSCQISIHLQDKGLAVFFPCKDTRVLAAHGWSGISKQAKAKVFGPPMDGFQQAQQWPPAK